MPEVTIFVLHPNREYCDQIAQAFRHYDPEMMIEVLVDLRNAPNRVREDSPAAIVVGVDTSNDPALKTIEAVSHMPGDVGIIVVSKSPSQELLVSCMRSGSDEFLEFPIDQEELAKAMGGLFKRKGIANQGQGKVIAVFSASGGVGVTTVACNLAAGIATELASPRASCIVDMNLQFGSVALAMDVREFSHTVADAAHEESRLDENLLRTFMSEHASGAGVLPAPTSLQDLEGIDPWRLRGVVQTCRKTYNHVVLDMPHAVDDASLVGLDEADEVLLLCDMLLPTIRHTIHALEVFHELEYKADKLKLVINRFYDSDQVSLDEIVEHVKLPVHWLIPYDSQVAIAALNSGQPFDTTDEESQATHSLIALAQHCAGIQPRPRPKKRRGLFSWAR
jgi:pilus assembly protein CpaE